VLAHCLKTCFMLYQTRRKLQAPISAGIATLEQLARDNPREQAHLAALQAWSGGDWYAAAGHWERLLLDYPRDLMALKLCQDMHFFLGNSEPLRDVIARVLPDWDEDLRGYGYLLGMYAFGLEECGDYRRAEDYGRRAVAIQPRDSWAIHAVAHVMEMENRLQEGIDWLNERREDWAQDSFFAIHQWWHLALYHFDSQQYDRVLQLYDQQIRREPSKLVLNLIDASSLLWRLALASDSIDLSSRAQELTSIWQPLAPDALSAFNDMHAMMAFVLAGDESAADTLLEAQQRGAAGDDDYARVTRTLGLPVCRALQAFGRGQYAEVVALLLPIRYALQPIGGSHAQRDLCAMTLLEAALRGGQQRLAKALLAERHALKPGSAYNRAKYGNLTL
jgi:tetratricopeptide (TPR) repeat protein